MSTFTTTVATACLLSTVLAAAPRAQDAAEASGTGSRAPAPAQEAEQGPGLDGLDKRALTELLNRLLDEIQGGLKIRVTPGAIEQRLRERTPHYRQIPIGDRVQPTTQHDGAGDQAGTPPPSGGEAAGMPPGETGSGPRTRLFGDAEKERLPEGTVMTVDGMPVSEAEVERLEKFYQGYTSTREGTPRQKAMGALITLKHVQSRYQEKLPELQKRIAALHDKAAAEGADFADLARNESECPSSAQGGDLGFFTRDRMVPEFSRVAFALGIGKVSEPFASPFGYHVCKLTGTRKGATPAEDEVRASHILVLLDKDSGSLRTLMQQGQQGQAKVAVLDDEWRKGLPAAYR